jgi:hypothetical protein
VKRRLSQIASALSLLLCLLMLAAWVRSYWRADEVGWDAHRSRGYFDSADGCVCLEAQIISQDKHQLWNFRSRDQSFLYSYLGLTSPIDRENFWPESTFLGLGFGSSDQEYGTEWRLLVPYWALAGLAAVMPGLSVWRRRRRRRLVATGHCVQCGYDLRASPSFSNSSRRSAPADNPNG